MGIQTAIAEKIKERRADYVLAPKGNQGTLHEDVKMFLMDNKEEGIINGQQKKHTGARIQLDRNKGILSDRRHKMAFTEEKLERLKEHRNGRKDHSEKKKRNIVIISVVKKRI